MPDKINNNGELFDAASAAESESVQWITLCLQRTIGAIRPARPEALLQNLFLARFRRHHARRCRIRKGIVGGSGFGGLGLCADALFDIEWAELFNNLLNWFGRPLALRVAEIASPYLDWLS